MLSRAITSEEADAIGRLLVVVGQPIRIRLIDALHRHGELSVQQLAEAVGVKVADASQHLAVLRRERVVLRRQEGRFAWYRLADESALTIYAAALAARSGASVAGIKRPAGGPGRSAARGGGRGCAVGSGEPSATARAADQARRGR